MSEAQVGVAEMTKGSSGWDLDQLELKDALPRWFFTWQG